jgi:uncharacterized protein YecE (DUF72 family)
METVTFETLPKAVSELNRKMDLILSQTQNQKQENQDRLFTIEQFLEYLPEHPARQTVYGWVNEREVPYEKYGKRLYFRKITIDKWLGNGRQK